MYLQYFTDEEGCKMEQDLFFDLCISNKCNAQKVMAEATELGYTFHKILGMDLEDWILLSFPERR